MRHGTHVGVQPVDRAVDVVQYPPAEEARNRHCDVEKDLRVHGLLINDVDGARVKCVCAVDCGNADLGKCVGERLI